MRAHDIVPLDAIALRIIENINADVARFKERLNSDWHFTNRQKQKAYQRRAKLKAESIKSLPTIFSKGVRGQHLSTRVSGERALVSGNVRPLAMETDTKIKGVDPWQLQPELNHETR